MAMMGMDSNWTDLEISLGIEWKSIYIYWDPTEYETAHREQAWEFPWCPD